MTRPALAFLLLAACGAKPSPPIGGLDNTSSGAPPDRSIRAIDWQNRSYDLGEFGTFTAVGGKYEYVMTTDGQSMSAVEYAGRFPGRENFEASGLFAVDAPVFGDVDRDGSEDAIVTTFIDSGGTGYFSDIYVFAMRGRAPAVLGAIPGGDRADGGIREVAVAADGAVQIQRNDGTGSGACCPSGIWHETWRWDGTAFAVDDATRRLEKLDDDAR